MKICFPLHRKKGEIFADLNKSGICIELYQELPVIGRPGPFVHLHSLATILDLSSKLPALLPMRAELQSLASRALDAAVADLGDDVELYGEGVGETPAYAK